MRIIIGVFLPINTFHVSEYITFTGKLPGTRCTKTFWCNERSNSATNYNAVKLCIYPKIQPYITQHGVLHYFLHATTGKWRISCYQSV